MFGKFKKPEVPGTLKIDDVEPIYPAFMLHNSWPNNGVVVNVKDDHSTKAKVKEEEEWIWVEGYKGTKSDMTAYGKFQYEMNKMYTMDDDAEIQACCSGFHLCKELEDVFNYYPIGNGRRFFKVRALVRKEDVENYGRERYYDKIDKLVSKQILLERELTPDEILFGSQYSDLTDDEKKLALAEDIGAVNRHRNIRKLVNAGYSEVFASYLATLAEHKIRKALAVASQPGLSIDMKVFAIMCDS